MDVTAKIARFATETKYDKIPAQAIETAKAAILDCLGVALAGSKEEDAKICAQIARQENAKQEATVFGQGVKTSSQQAAFANGTAAHAMDFDHSFTLMGQPTAPIIPAVFSLGDSLGASGKQIFEAYTVGYEVTAKLAYSLRDSKHDGWHAPSTLGCFGASAACAKLLGLNTVQTQMALGITASMAGGIVGNFGTMTKPLHVGLGARNGVLAAKLAQSGFTANTQAIESGFGLYKVLHPTATVHEEPIEELGRSYALLSDGIRVKPYPCGGLTHQAIDSVLEFKTKHGITADNVESIQVDVTKHTFERIVFRVPQNGIQGKFCMNYLLARAIIDGTIGLHIFTDEAVKDAQVLKLAERVQMRLDPDLKAGSPGGRPCRVTIRLKNGQTYSCQAEYAKGGPENPMTRDELKAKFMECARETVSPVAAERISDSIERLETLENIRPMCELLAG